MFYLATHRAFFFLFFFLVTVSLKPEVDLTAQEVQGHAL